MLSSMQLHFGESPSADRLALELTPVTVFVGPNNSGKSVALREISILCKSINNETRIIHSIEFGESDFRSKEHIFRRIVTPTSEQRSSGLDTSHAALLIKDLERAIESNDTKDISKACKVFAGHLIMTLWGADRTTVQEVDGGDLQEPPRNSHSVILRNKRIRQSIRQVLFDAFGLHCVIDPTDLGKLKVRFSKEPPTDDEVEIGIREKSVAFHRAATLLKDYSDGVRSFTKTIISLYADQPQIVLIDEPEAFLHPPLAQTLGRQISIAALNTHKRVFASTHSAAFIMGCIQSGVDVNIVRLTYSKGTPTARLLRFDQLKRLMRNPLLRSIGVLNALFYESVVVCESDADASFYQEVNERMLSQIPKRGIQNCLFLRAQNKQTIHQIVRPLRDMGIPTAAIVDIDVIKDGGKSWIDLTESANVPSVRREVLGHNRSILKVKFSEDMKKHGIDALNKNDRDSAKDFLSDLADYGIFAVPGGELESWLKWLGVAGHGPTWLVSVFEKMGEDPQSENYIHPGTDDVWAFIDSVGAWLANNNRKGMP